MTEASKTRDKSFDPISHTEKEIEDLVYKTERTQPRNTQSLPRSRTTTLDLENREAIDHDKNNKNNTNPPLPETQQRVSSTKRKRSKLLEDYILGSQ